MSAIGPGADPERSASILREWGITGFSHIADDGRVGILFDVYGTPGMAVVTANGSVASHTGGAGPGGYDDLIQAARALDSVLDRGDTFLVPRGGGPHGGPPAPGVRPRILP